MDLHFPGWQLLGAFPDNEPNDVGSWLLHHNGEAALLEIPPGLTKKIVKQALGNRTLRLVAASHEHEDHFDMVAWEGLKRHFVETPFLQPGRVYTFPGELCFSLGGEPLWFIGAPKHSLSDMVTVFRGVAMTGDIELNQLASVNREVPKSVKRESMRWLRDFPKRHNYRIHTIVSAHLNDVRTNVDWPVLFDVVD